MANKAIKILNPKLMRAIAKEEADAPRDLFFPNISKKLEAIKANPGLATRYGVAENDVFA